MIQLALNSPGEPRGPRIALNSATARVPAKAHKDDAGWDLFTPEDVELVEGEINMVDLRIRVAIPEGYFGLVVPRSSMAKRRILLANTVGIIDSGYRGNIKVPLIYSPTIDMPLTTMVYHDERIAQIIIVPYLTQEIGQVDSLDDTDRSDGGFGSSGK
jgi:dUTP pyrophosphatase